MDYHAKASGFRLYTEEVRARAEAMCDEQSKQYMLRLANHYEQLANDYNDIAELKIPA